MTRICVVINDIGGIPHTLHKNITTQHHTWSDSSHTDIPIPSTDPTEGLKCITKGTTSETIFSVVGSRGVSTVFAGPSCNLRRFSDDDHRLVDPESTLVHIGVERCSPYDDSCLLGTSGVYDDNTVRYATDAVRSARNERIPLLLWVNLLALRDVNYTHTHLATTPRDVRNDQRTQPESLHSIVANVTEFHRPDEHRPVIRHTEAEFSAALHYSSDVLERHMKRVQRFILNVLEECPDAHVCHTASHSLSLGEHGMRGGMTPMSTSCTTFMVSHPATRVGNNLDVMVSSFILDAFHLAHPPDLGMPTTRIPSMGMTRTLVLWNDHKYAVLERNGDIQNVFDLSTDPFELNDIVGNISHIRAQLLSTIHGNEPVVAAPRPDPVSLPSPSQSDISITIGTSFPQRPSPSEISTIADTPTMILRKPSFERRQRQSTTSTQGSQNVRRAEQRLSKLHR